MGRQHVFCAQDRYTKHSLPPYASVSGRYRWLAWRMGLCSPDMAISYSSHFPQQLLTPASSLRPQHSMSSATKLICSSGAPNGCARKSCWHQGPCCTFSTSASAVPHLPGSKAWQAIRQGRPILPGFQEPRANRKTAPAILRDPSPAHRWKHMLETSVVLISWRIH